ncbi:MAG: hypothetical protein DHS20C15_20350 [Planctomycetota bacterium]|nr:MAG: hypothetical protein DHS20C15_20350 [Planctomycetota bacterium]
MAGLDLEGLQHAELVHPLVLGEGADGRPIQALVIGAEPTRLADRRGMLLVAGLDGRRVGEAELLAEVVRVLDTREDLAERLGDAVLVIVPRANGAGAAAGVAGNGTPDDRDRDGRVDEDGPSDLDGDGRVLWMRVPDPSGDWVIDEHDPRALRQPNAEKGERATHRLLREGLDDDGDGAFHEDDHSGFEPDRNFSHDWREHEPGSGRFPLQTPEARALATLLLEHPGLLAVLHVGEADSLVHELSVDKNPGRRRFGGFSNWLSGVLDDDAVTLKQFGRRFGEAASGKHEVKGSDLQPGSLLAWAYHEAGRWPLGFTPWEAPKEFPPEEEEEGEADADLDPGADDGDQADADGTDARAASAETKPVGASGPADAADAAEADAAEASAEAAAAAAAAEPDAASESSAAAESGAEPEPEPEPTTDVSSPAPAALLAWLDREGRSEDFVEWTAFDHPQLGAVEIGGVDPAVMFSGPWEADARTALAERAAAFTLDVLDDFPALTVENLEVEARGDGAYAISLALVNTGRLPTSSRFAADSRTARPMRVRLALPDGAARLAGPQEVLVDRLDGLGGRRELRWLIAGASPGDRVVLTVDADTVPDLEQEIELP